MVRKATIRPGVQARLQTNAAAYTRASSEAPFFCGAQCHAKEASRAIVLVGIKGERDAQRDRADQDWGEARASWCVQVRGQHIA